ncbi:hypothetical protein [Streptomyces virginiae]|uniref:hypothetical protein n=1 Tax=Streptomyces virginiae TaxID=1961 RepID=UPI00343EE1C1
MLMRPVVLVGAAGPGVCSECASCAPSARVRRLLRDPAVRWVPYDAEVVRMPWRPPVLAQTALAAAGPAALPRRPVPPRPDGLTGRRP